MTNSDVNEAVVAANLFNVDGLVAFITGGGTGEYMRRISRVGSRLSLPR